MNGSFWVTPITGIVTGWHVFCCVLLYFLKVVYCNQKRSWWSTNLSYLAFLMIKAHREACCKEGEVAYSVTLLRRGGRGCIFMGLSAFNLGNLLV